MAIRHDGKPFIDEWVPPPRPSMPGSGSCCRSPACRYGTCWSGTASPRRSTAEHGARPPRRLAGEGWCCATSRHQRPNTCFTSCAGEPKVPDFGARPRGLSRPQPDQYYWMGTSRLSAENGDGRWSSSTWQRFRTCKDTTELREIRLLEKNGPADAVGLRRQPRPGRAPGTAWPRPLEITASPACPQAQHQLTFEPFRDQQHHRRLKENR